MRHFEDTKETPQKKNEEGDISSKGGYFFYTRGRFIWIAAKGGKLL